MKKIIWSLAILPTIVTAVALKFMPDTVPLHYNFAGEIDRWGSKYEHFLMPVFLIVWVILMQVITYFQEKKIGDEPTPREQASRRNNIKVVRIVTIAFEIFWLILICWMLWTSKENANIETAQASTSIGQFIWIAMGILLVVIGNILPKSRMNSVVGVRTTWSMYNEETWSKSNRFVGIVLMVTGVAMVIASLILKESALFLANIGLIVLSSIVILVYTYKVFKGIDK